MPRFRFGMEFAGFHAGAPVLVAQLATEVERLNLELSALAEVMLQEGRGAS